MSVAAWRHHLTDWLRDTLVTLCSIPSPSLEERDVANAIRSMLNEWGLTVHEDDAGHALGGNSGNLIAELPGSAPGRVAFVAHMDTVPLVPGKPLAPVVEGDRVHSGGNQILGADDKAGVTIALALARGLLATPSSERPTVVLVFTIAEERGLLGARELDGRALGADFAFVLDGEVPVGQVITRAPFKERVTLTVHGKRAHAALEPELGVHAIAAAADVIQAFPIGRLTHSSVTNLGIVHGGTATNVVPDSVTLVGEVRTFEESELDALVARLDSLTKHAAGSQDARLSFERVRLYDGYNIPGDAYSVLRNELKTC